MSSIVSISNNIFSECFFIIVTNFQNSFINLVGSYINNNVKEKKKVKFNELNIQENESNKKQKIIDIYSNIPQKVRQSIRKPKIIIQESNDDYDFFVYFE